MLASITSSSGSKLASGCACRESARFRSRAAPRARARQPISVKAVVRKQINVDAPRHENRNRRHRQRVGSEPKTARGAKQRERGASGLVDCSLDRQFAAIGVGQKTVCPRQNFAARPADQRDQPSEKKYGVNAINTSIFGLLLPLLAPVTALFLSTTAIAVCKSHAPAPTPTHQCEPALNSCTNTAPSHSMSNASNHAIPSKKKYRA